MPTDWSLVGRRSDIEIAEATGQSFARESGIEHPTGWFSEMKANRAGRSRILATWIQGASMIIIDHPILQVMEVGFEQRLKTAQHEIAPGGSIDEK